MMLELTQVLGEPKEYRIRIETAEESEIDDIVSKLKQLFDVGEVKTYPRRNGGYHHYLTITGHFQTSK